MNTILNNHIKHNNQIKLGVIKIDICNYDNNSGKRIVCIDDI